VTGVGTGRARSAFLLLDISPSKWLVSRLLSFDRSVAIGLMLVASPAFRLRHGSDPSVAIFAARSAASLHS
jgi:hypothetical protein